MPIEASVNRYGGANYSPAADHCVLQTYVESAFILLVLGRVFALCSYLILSEEV
jgi:hypothetical protein